MPYRSNADLPAAVRAHLPQRAQAIYREAFNHAWNQYAKSPRREEIAHRVAWAAVKRRYVKTEAGWVSQASGRMHPPDNGSVRR